VPAKKRLTAATIVCKSIQGTVNSVTARAESEQAPDGAPDSEQDLSGAPQDCLVAHMSEAPTVEP
jgi:hypothetical protein